MADRTMRVLFLTTLLALGNLASYAAAPAGAEPIPAPTEALKDYVGTGVIQVDVPTSIADGKAAAEGSFTTWVPFRQGYVRPDRLLLVLSVSGILQGMVVSGDTERIYSPSTGYVLQRQYKNVETATENPMTAVQLSMATYAKILRELNTGKILPAEDLDAVKARLTARNAELIKLRKELAELKRPEDANKANAAAAEHTRVRDDLDQIEIRRAHPCHVVEFPNHDLVRTLFSRGLAGLTGAEILSKGKTTVWITKAQGLPIKIETTDNDGRIALFFCFKELKINSGLHPTELVLGYPPGSRLISASADLRDRNWQEKMENSISRQIEAYTKATNPQPQGRRPLQKRN